MRMRRLMAVPALVLLLAASCTSQSTTSTATEGTELPEATEPVDDETRARAMRLVEDIEGSSVGGVLGDAVTDSATSASGPGGEVDDPFADPALEECLIDAVIARPELFDIDIDAIGPEDPEAVVLLEMVLSCIGRDAIMEVFAAELVGIPTTIQDCMLAEMNALNDEEFVAFLLAAAVEDEAAFEAVLGPCFP